MKNLKNYIIILSTIILLSTTVYAKRYALIIGISEYENKAYNLNLSDSDALTIKNYLIKYCKIKEGNVTILLNAKAQKSSIFKHLDRYASILKKQDEFIFYFSGHGYRDIYPDNSSTDTDKKNEYLVPWEGDANNQSTLIKDKIIYEKFKKFNKIKNLFVILDSCHSGGAAKNIFSKPNYIIKDIDLKNSILLAAARPNEFAQERPNEFPNSVFTYFLCKAIKGECEKDNKYGITIDEINDYLKNNVSKITSGKQNVYIIDNTKRNPVLSFPNFSLSLSITPIKNTTVYLNKVPYYNEEIFLQTNNSFIISDLKPDKYEINVFNPNYVFSIKKEVDIVDKNINLNLQFTKEQQNTNVENYNIFHPNLKINISTIDSFAEKNNNNGEIKLKINLDNSNLYNVAKYLKIKLILDKNIEIINNNQLEFIKSISNKKIYDLKIPNDLVIYNYTNVDYANINFILNKINNLNSIDNLMFFKFYKNSYTYLYSYSFTISYQAEFFPPKQEHFYIIVLPKNKPILIKLESNIVNKTDIIIDCFEKLLDKINNPISDTDISKFYILQNLYAEKKDYEKLEKNYLKFIDLGNIEALNSLAWFYVTSEVVKYQKYDEALDLALKAVKLTNRKKWHILDTLAEVYYKKNDLENALKINNEALEKITNAEDKQILLKSKERYKKNVR